MPRCKRRRHGEVGGAPASVLAEPRILAATKKRRAGGPGSRPVGLSRRRCSAWRAWCENPFSHHASSRRPRSGRPTSIWVRWPASAPAPLLSWWDGRPRPSPSFPRSGNQGARPHEGGFARVDENGAGVAAPKARALQHRRRGRCSTEGARTLSRWIFVAAWKKVALAVGALVRKASSVGRLSRRCEKGFSHQDREGILAPGSILGLGGMGILPVPFIPAQRKSRFDHADWPEHRCSMSSVRPARAGVAP